MTVCKWNGSDSPRILPGRHDAECPKQGLAADSGDFQIESVAVDGCEGCALCPEPHCCGDACRGRNHAETICEECITAARDDLDAVVDLYARLRTEAIACGTRGDRTDTVLGGDAMVMLAMTYPDQTGSRAETHEHERKNDPVPPLVTLAGWEDIYREQFGQPTDLTASVERAAAYLDRQMHRMAEDAEIPFDEFAREVRQLRARMEDVLHDGERDEKGAPCVQCERPMVRVTTDQGAQDAYHCSPCRRTVSGDQYRYAVGAAYRAHAKALNATDMQRQYDVKPGTLTGWATLRATDDQPRVRKRGKDANGRQLYDVADVCRMLGLDEAESA